MKIPFLDLAAIHTPLEHEFHSAFKRVLDRSQFILGDECDAFEREFAAYCQCQFSIGVGNGMDALSLSLRALNIGKGDEVIVPSHTFIATFLAVMQCGAIPVPVEVKKDTMNIDPSRISEAVTSRTKAVIPVHLYGQPCEMELIMEVAQQHQLSIIEDNAQAQGARFKNKRTGSFGILNATSFYPGKNLGALGDAGAITTSSSTLAEDLRKRRNYGSAEKYHHELPGVNSRMDELQAAFLRIKLRSLDAGNARRQVIALKYQSLLHGVGDIVLPTIATDAESVYHLYVIRSEKREQLSEYLKKQGVGTLIHYPLPPHKQKALSELNIKGGAFAITESISEQCLSIPCHEVMSEAQAEYIAEAIKAFYHG